MSRGADPVLPCQGTFDGSKKSNRVIRSGVEFVVNTSAGIHKDVDETAIRRGLTTRSINSCMFTVEPRKGHARSTFKLLSAMGRRGKDQGYRFTPVTSENPARPACPPEPGLLPYVEFSSQNWVLRQAIAHGRPVVASDLGGTAERVRAWGVGELERPRDPRALGAGIVEALLPAAYFDAVATTSSLLERLTGDSMAEATLDVYRSALS